MVTEGLRQVIIFILYHYPPDPVAELNVLVYPSTILYNNSADLLNLATTSQSFSRQGFSMKKYLYLLLVCSLFFTACQSENTDHSASLSQTSSPVTTSEATSDKTKENPAPQAVPPSPPLYENFQSRPQLSLFPRAGAFRPEDDDEQGLQFWRTYIDHMVRTSGPIKPDADAENIVFGFRAIKGLDSVGVFATIAVKPSTSYAVSARFTCNLTEGASTGIGLQEFNKFMWIGEQYSESLARQTQLGTQQGFSLSGKVEKQLNTFTFTTGPETRMVHLIFFRDGSHDRNPVLIDDIEIKVSGSSQHAPEQK